MAPTATQRGCSICGSPDMACGGHNPTTGRALIDRPAPAKNYTGELVEAMRPGPNGGYRVRARLDEALDKGWQVLGIDPYAGLTKLGGGWFELPDGSKVQGEEKARNAFNKARGPGGIK